MEKELRLRLHSNGKWSLISDVSILGHSMENKATVLVVELPEESFGNSHFLEFIKPSGDIVSSMKLEEKTNKSGIHYILLETPNALINEYGRYQMQYVGRRKSGATEKSEIRTLEVLKSINADLTIEQDNKDIIGWLVSKIEELENNKSGSPQITALGNGRYSITYEGWLTNLGDGRYSFN